MTFILFQGELDYEIQPNDRIVFISTLHGGWCLQYWNNSLEKSRSWQFQICLESFLYRNQNLFTSWCFVDQTGSTKKKQHYFYMNGIAYLFFTTLITIVKCHSSMPARLNKWYNTATSLCSWNPPKNSVTKDIRYIKYNLSDCMFWLYLILSIF